MDASRYATWVWCYSPRSTSFKLGLRMDIQRIFRVMFLKTEPVGA
jgi:hypothetical protein